MATITIRVDDEVKKEAGALFDDLGLDLSTAINIFLRKSIARDGLPFSVEREKPNAETLAAIAEGEKIINDIRAGKSNGKLYGSFAEVLEDLGDDGEV